jgi:DNA ligase-associated metallophosphoesterase
MTYQNASGDYALTLAGEQVYLLPERAIWWPAATTLLIADVHLGKTAAFLAFARAAPHGAANADLGRLSALIERTNASRVVILGDLVHARVARTPTVMVHFAAWRAQHPALDILLIRGNHDQNAGDPPSEWGIACVDEPFALGPFALAHYPDVVAPGYLLAGHVHPAVRRFGRGRQNEQLPCFLFGPQRGILPAFGSFTSAADMFPNASEQAYVIVDQTVQPIN